MGEDMTQGREKTPIAIGTLTNARQVLRSSSFGVRDLENAIMGVSGIGHPTKNKGDRYRRTHVHHTCRWMRVVNRIG